jgi:ABC-2 type transport system permease protein
VTSGVTSASLPFLAHHEFRLAWRDWWSMLTAGKRKRARVVVLMLLAIAVGMHFVAVSVVGQFAEIEPDADRGTLVVITGCALLAWSLMMSQAMEQVTRAFYARSDLDLILSSPTASRRVFAVRIGAMAISTMLMAMLLAAPFINVLIWRGGARWWSPTAWCSRFAPRRRRCRLRSPCSCSAPSGRSGRGLPRRSSPPSSARPS